MGLSIAACWGLSGCVVGYGHCLFMSPVKHTLTGRVHFRSYPAADGSDQVPVLALDSTAYLYSPAHSQHCLSVNELQLTEVTEFPPQVIEGSHVSVEGSLFEAASAREHTAFLMTVSSILPLRQP